MEPAPALDAADLNAAHFLFVADYFADLCSSSASGRNTTSMYPSHVLHPAALFPSTHTVGSPVRTAAGPFCLMPHLVALLLRSTTLHAWMMDASNATLHLHSGANWSCTLTRSEAGLTFHIPAFFQQIGKLVNAARSMGLGMDPDAFLGRCSLFESETRLCS
jgi:hypothetical protein